jgi:hypothetical protein
VSRRTPKAVVPVLVLALGLEPAALAGEPGGKARYVGGTVAALANRPKGELLTTDTDYFEFRTGGGTFRLPYQQINLLEYGQKVGRRFLLAAAVTPLCVPLGAILLLSKKRSHFLTVGYSDEDGRQQALVFEVNKGGIRVVLATLEARTGIKVTYQDDEARKAGKG